MSLFGTSPEDPSAVSSTPAQKSKASLFADEPAGGSSSLFADDTGDDSSSWNPQNNTAKRTARRDLVRTLLPATDVPESYVDAYDLILNSGDRVGSVVGLSSIREILSSSNLTASDQGKILNLVVSSDNETSGGLGRAEFNVLLALIGLAQEGEDLSFDAVDDHRKSKFIASVRYGGIVAELCFPTLYHSDRIVLRTILQSSPNPTATSLTDCDPRLMIPPMATQTSDQPHPPPSLPLYKNQIPRDLDNQDGSRSSAWNRIPGQARNCIGITLTPQ